MATTIGTFGVEAVEDPNAELWEPPILTYCNTGDTYAPTILYRLATDAYSIGSWGDVVESENL